MALLEMLHCTCKCWVYFPSNTNRRRILCIVSCKEQEMEFQSERGKCSEMCLKCFWILHSVIMKQPHLNIGLPVVYYYRIPRHICPLHLLPLPALPPVAQARCDTVWRAAGWSRSQSLQGDVGQQWRLHQQTVYRNSSHEGSLEPVWQYWAPVWCHYDAIRSSLCDVIMMSLYLLMMSIVIII